ncbi:B12-binding domain-containing radical SAM protein [Desulfonema magnum]|uniref:Cobalamin-binding radical SAM domain protein n=1 Tax=Desulfonema magnum TaxID=45655 RepID=A0A975BJK0_9BACT|nr:radical SAM protein [Desulfonema magnum]QTA86305.1 Cobalamin-binding radical SAM domain protein [Desulfonema magnum]
MSRYEQKRCVLISTPMAGYICPAGILSISSFLEANGYPTEIVPLAYYLNYKKDWDLQDIRSILEDFIRKNEPVLVGVSNQITPDYPTCIEILKICKEVNESVITVIGGVHVTFQDTDCMRSRFVDIVVRGEGEWTMLDLISALENGRDLHDVKGITFRENGRIIRTPDRPLGNLNELPSPNYELLPFEFVQKSTNSGMMSRGCAFHCAFCAEGAFWKKYRKFPVTRIIEEMEILDRVYKNPMVGLSDSMVYPGSEQLSEFCREVQKRKLRLRPEFAVLSRVDTISEQGLKEMKNIHIQCVAMGIESGSPNVLKMMNKKISPDQIIPACTKLREHGLDVRTYWIIGHPGDNLAEAEYSLELLQYLLNEDLIQEASVDMFSPVPGTRFFEQPGKYGIEILLEDWSEWFIPDKPICRLKDFSEKDILATFHKACDIVKRAGAAKTRYDKEAIDRYAML